MPLARIAPRISHLLSKRATNVLRIYLVDARAPQCCGRRAMPITNFTVFGPVRYSTQSNTSERRPKPYTFAEVKKYASGSATDGLLIDVREPNEINAWGTIPRSINIPVHSLMESFSMSDNLFKERFGFERPAKDTKLIFFCESGFRSSFAAQVTIDAGWENVGDYEAGWSEWYHSAGERYLPNRTEKEISPEELRKYELSRNQH